MYVCSCVGVPYQWIYRRMQNYGYSRPLLREVRFGTDPPLQRFPIVRGMLHLRRFPLTPRRTSEG